MTGADRVKFLNGFCTNDLKRLTVGQGCEAFVTNVKGKVVAHVWIDVDESSLWLESTTPSTDVLRAHLERYIINEDVALIDRTADCGVLLVLGPRAALALERIGVERGSLSETGHRIVAGPEGPIRVRRFNLGQSAGYTLTVARSRLAQVWTQLREAGATPVGSQVWTALRIEAGLPLEGIDFSDDNLAQEIGRTVTAISFTKGCYLGQEPIARINAMGHVNRELRSLRLESSAVPALGAEIYLDAPATQPVGAVTSAAFSYGSGKGVAMSLVRSAAAVPGSRVFVKTDDGLAPAIIFWPPAEQSES
jgi:folate-binding protein YgfZ